MSSHRHNILHARYHAERLARLSAVTKPKSQGGKEDFKIMLAALIILGIAFMFLFYPLLQNKFKNESNTRCEDGYNKKGM